MKWEGLTINKEKGQSLLELLIAMAVFVLAVTAISWLVLDVYLADRVGRENMIATFLAKEGMEAARSIRDNGWDDLSAGSHGLVISGGSWIFQGTEEDVSGKLREGIRTVTVEDIDGDRVMVTSQVSWEITPLRSSEVTLVTYLTNWGEFEEAEAPEFESCSDYCESLDYEYGQCKKNEGKCNQAGGIYQSGGDNYCSPPDNACCCFE